MKKALAKAKLIYPWISIDQVNRKLKQMKEKDAADDNDEFTVVLNVATTNVATALQLEVPLADLRTSVGGRPKGTTLEAAATMTSRKRKAVNDASILYHKAKTEAKKKGSRVKNGCVDQIIKEVLSEAKLDVDDPTFKIPRDTVIARVHRNRSLTNSTPGSPSPLALVEPYLVQICLQKALMGQPMGATEGLAMANSIIEDTIHQQKMIDWKIKSGLTGDSLGTLVLPEPTLSPCHQSQPEVVCTSGMQQTSNCTAWVGPLE